MTPDPAKPPANPDLESLCREATAGNVDALTRLLAIYHERLHEHAVRRVGPDWRGKLDPEDVLQDAYFDIFSDVGSFVYRGTDSFYHWAAQIVDRRHVDQVRRLKTRKRDVGREHSLAPGGARTSSYHRLLDQHMHFSGTASRMARTSEAVGVAMCALARLPEDYRLVVRRVHLNGEPVTVVAAEMGRSDDAIRRLADRALDRLRQLVEEALA